MALPTVASHLRELRGEGEKWRDASGEGVGLQRCASPQQRARMLLLFCLRYERELCAAA
eukprot:SAG11_NODE_17744_length_510_cov_0.737226_1_plen_59_part_00